MAKYKKKSRPTSRSALTKKQIVALNPLLPAGGNQFLFSVAFAGTVLLLFYPPFFRGLFFPVEQRWTLLLAIVLFFITYLWKLSCREVTFLKGPLDYTAAALVVVYILAALKPASQSLAVAEVAKVLLYFLVYWLVARLGGEERNTYFIHALYLATVGTALAALLTATELIYIKDGFLGGRFYSTLQYPNALASYVGAGLILGFYLWAKAGQNYRYLYGAANYLLLMVYLGSGSRGAYLLFPPLLVLFCILTPKSYRKEVTIHLIICLVAALAANVGFIPNAVAKSYFAAWGWFGLGLIVALGGQYLLLLVSRLLASPRAVKALAVFVAVVLLLAGGLFLASQPAVQPTANSDQPEGILNRIIPPQIMSRLQSINLATSSSQHRLYWTEDALKMVKDRPLLGFGGGGWEAAYRQYQSYFYNSTQVHNHYAQVAVETGLLGFTVLATIWLLFLFCIGRCYSRNQGQGRLLPLAVGIAALYLGVHAVIDFNLALGAISILLWACFGMARSLDTRYPVTMPALSPRVFKQKQVAYFTAITLACLVMFVFCISYLLGVSCTYRAAAALQHNNLEATAVSLAEASRYDPFTASYHYDLAGIYLNLGDADNALKYALAASNREPYNVSILTRLAEAYWQCGQIEQAVATMERARDASPWVAGIWENLGQTYTAAGIHYLKTGQEENARQMFMLAADLTAEIEARLVALEKYKNLHQSGGLELTPLIYLRQAIGQYFLGQYENAAANLNLAAADPAVKAEAQLWQAVLAFQEGNEAQAEQLLAEVAEINSDLAAHYVDYKSITPLNN